MGPAGFCQCSNNGVPNEGVWVLDVVEEGEGVVSGDVVVGVGAESEELGEDEDVLVEASANDAGVELFQMAHCDA